MKLKLFIYKKVTKFLESVALQMILTVTRIKWLVGIKNPVAIIRMTETYLITRVHLHCDLNKENTVIMTLSDVVYRPCTR